MFSFILVACTLMEHGPVLDQDRIQFDACDAILHDMSGPQALATRGGDVDYLLVTQSPGV